MSTYFSRVDYQERLGCWSVLTEEELEKQNLKKSKQVH